MKLGSKSTMNRSTKIRLSLIKKCMLVDFLIIYIGPPNYVHYYVWSIKFEDVLQSLLNITKI